LSLKKNLGRAGFQDVIIHYELKTSWFRAAIAYKKMKWFADPFLWLADFTPIHWLLIKTSLKVFFATDLYAIGIKK